MDAWDAMFDAAEVVKSTAARKCKDGKTRRSELLVGANDVTPEAFAEAAVHGIVSTKTGKTVVDGDEVTLKNAITKDNAVYGAAARAAVCSLLGLPVPTAKKKPAPEKGAPAADGAPAPAAK